MGERFRQEVLTGQFQLLVRQVPALVGGSSVLGVGTALILRHQGMDVALVQGWCTCILVVSGARFISWLRLRRSAPKTPAEFRRWSLIFVGFSATAGTIWGSLALLFFNPGDPLTLALISIIQASILASAINSLAPYWPAHLAFGLPCVLPLVARCLLEDSDALNILGVLAFFFLVFSSVFARSIERSIRESLHLRFENIDLMERLLVAKRKAERADTAKSRLLAAASHDLRQPVYAMSLLAGVLEAGQANQPTDVEVVAQMARRMHGDLEVMGQMVDRLLDASRLEDGNIQPRLQPTLVHTAISRVAAQHQRMAQVKGLRLRAIGIEEWIVTDPVLFHSIVSNLVANAIKYTRSGGVLLASRRRGEGVAIEVWDTGIGIPAADIDRIHDEFFQAGNAREIDGESHGFGLGLSIVKRFAAMLGLEISVRSCVGHGSLFRVMVPHREEALAASMPAPAEVETASTPVRSTVD